MKKDKEEKETKREKKRVSTLVHLECSCISFQFLHYQDRDDSVADSSVKKRRDESERMESPPARQNGSEEKRKSSSDRKRFVKLLFVNDIL